MHRLRAPATMTSSPNGDNDLTDLLYQFEVLSVVRAEAQRYSYPAGVGAVSYFNTRTGSELGGKSAALIGSQGSKERSLCEGGAE